MAQPWEWQAKVRAKFRSSWRARIAEATYKIIQEFNEMGIYEFTVRQLSYQLVVGGLWNQPSRIIKTLMPS